MNHFPTSPFPELHTPRLTLRQIQHSDTPALYEIRTNPKALQYFERAPLENMEAALALLQKIEQGYQSKESILWVLAAQGPAKPMMGTCGFWRIEWENRRAEVGYLLHPDFWNRGYMTEALQALIPYAFYTLQLHSLEANVNPKNIGSIRVLEKLGFVQEGYFRENIHFNNQYYDTAVFSLLSPV